MREGININPPAPANIRPAIPPKAPPQLRKLELRDGDVLCLPADTRYECAQDFADQLRKLYPDKRFLLITEDVQVLDEEAMNAAGWYRK